MQEQEDAFTAMHHAGRARLQQYIKKHSLRDAWASAGEFLDRQWTTKEHLGSYIERVWEKLDLPGEAPVDHLFTNETWRLFFDGQGIGAFERSISERPPKRVQQMDLLQLVYLGGTRRRMMVSNDGGMLRAAHAVLHRRYLGTRVANISDLIS